jgi:hypothetical protein
MTRADRIATLAALQLAHPTLTCHIFNCASCAKYYALLLAPDEAD